MLTAALFTVTKLGDQLKYPPVDKCMKTMCISVCLSIYLYYGIQSILKKQRNSFVYNGINKSVEHYTKLKKPGTGKQKAHVLTCR
jgi:hypothetical protein